MGTLIAVLLIHSFYDPGCCGGRDCQPVPCEQISPVMDGWVWEHTIWFTRGQLHPSPDGGCHVCISKVKPPQGICIYLPPET